MYKIDSETVCSSKVDDETLILNLDTGFYYTLDGIGGIIWDHLLKNDDEDRIIEAIVGTYQVGAEEARNDFRELVESLGKENLLRKI